MSWRAALAAAALMAGTAGAQAPQAPAPEPTTLKVGDTAPDFSLKSLDGKAVRLSELLRSNEAVVVTFFVAGNSLCSAQLIELQRLWDTFHTRGFEVVPINVEPRENAGAINTLWFHNKFRMMATKAEPGPNNPVRAYRVQVVPTSYIVGKDGKIVAAWYGYDPDKGAQHLKQQVARAGFR